MIKKSEVNKDIFRAWADSYAAVSKMWEDSYINPYKPWFESTGEMFEKAVELSKEATPEKYKEYYNMWMKSYEKIFDEFLSMSSQESMKDIFENYIGIPNIYFRNFIQMSKLWKSSFVDLSLPWVDPMVKLSEKMADISRGDAGPEAYKEFYNLWMNTYQETYGMILNIQPLGPSKEMFENLLQSTNIYLNMYKSWLSVLEKMSEKMKDLSGRTADPEAYKEFYSLWIKTYEKAFEDFFENMPMIDSMKKMMEPIKSAAKIYTATFANMANMWIRSGAGSTSQD
jgi:hypothetical protein